MFGMAEVLTEAGNIVTTAVTTTGQLVNALPFMMLPAAFIFGRKLIGMGKSLVFAGGRRRK